MSFREFPLRNGFWPAALGLAVVSGLAEAAFIFTAREGIAGKGFPVFPILAAFVALRFLLQITLVRWETSAVSKGVSELRNGILRVLKKSAVPAYRAVLRRTLIHTIQETAPRAGEGFLAHARFRAATLQAAILIPCLFFFSWRLALLFLPMAATAFFATRWRTRRLRNLERVEAQSKIDSRCTVEDFGENLETLLAAPLESATQDLSEKLLHIQVSESAWKHAQAYYPALMELIFFFALAVLVLAAQSLSAPQGWDVWMVFSGLLLLAYRPVREAARNYPQKLQGAQALADIDKIADEWNAYPPRALPELSNRPTETVVLENVNFGYGPRYSTGEIESLVFQNYSAEFDVHSLTGIVGPNGSGKTTLLRLFAGVEIPHRGKVFWSESLRSHGEVAYLPQRIFLERNYSKWAKEFATSDPIFWSHLDSLLGLSRLLHGNFHPENLSGGEKQRLALARVLASDAPFLLLDEPTSALPGHEREAVLTGVLNLWKNRVGKPRGALIVSHELFLGQCCDSLFSLRGIPTPENSPA